MNQYQIIDAAVLSKGNHPFTLSDIYLHVASNPASIKESYVRRRCFDLEKMGILSRIGNRPIQYIVVGEVIAPTQRHQKAPTTTISSRTSNYPTPH